MTAALNRSQTRLLRLLLQIYERGQVSRSELTQVTGSSTFLVSRMCEELIRTGLACELGPGNSTGGRPPALLAVNPELGCLAGLHVGTVNARIAVTDIACNLLAYRKVPSRAAEGPETALPHLLEETEKCLAAAGVRRKDLRGLGIGISGVLERETGTTLFWPKLPRWRDVPTRDMFGHHFQVPVAVEDSPRTMALAERRFGGGDRGNPFVYIGIGAGTGAAIFLGGEMLTGSRGFAGEFGHVSIDPNGPPCSCGGRGCLETLVSASALIRQARTAVAQGFSLELWHLSRGQEDSVSVEMIARAAAQGDRYCQNLLRTAGTHLGVSLAGLVNLLNPELIILGGGLALAAGDVLVPAAESAVRERALPRSAAAVEIRLSRLQESDWARGAALLLTAQVLENCFQERVAGLREIS